MNILIVDGNEKEASDRYTKMGMDTQFKVYEKILKNKSKTKINVTIIHPAVDDQYLPRNDRKSSRSRCADANCSLHGRYCGNSNPYCSDKRNGIGNNF